MSNQPSRPTQIKVFYSDQQIQGRRPVIGGSMPDAENVNSYDTPSAGSPAMTRKGYKSDYPNRMRNGKPGA